MGSALNVSVSPAILAGSPLVSRERFAEMLFGSRESVGIVIGIINKGYLPTVSIGKYSFINLAILHKQCLEKEFSL